MTEGYVVTGAHITNGVVLYAAARGKGDRGQTPDLADAQFFRSARSADTRRWQMANPYVFWAIADARRLPDGTIEVVP